MSTVFLVFGCLLLISVFSALRYAAIENKWKIEFVEGGHDTLIVYGPPLDGRSARPELEEFLKGKFPEADILIPTYRNNLASNTDPYAMASRIEHAVRERDDLYEYKKIILFGYSFGGLLLRKVYVWGHGIDDDRPVRHARHGWVDRVDRFVSLAAPNRGWPSHKPENLHWFRYLMAYVAEHVGRLTGAGRLVLNLRQGSPFVANLRVQWIDRFRALNSPGHRKPLVVHIIGDKDELVDRSDSIDLEAGASANDVMIKTIEGLSHAEIASQLYEGDGRATAVGDALQLALTRELGKFPPLWADRVGALETHPDVKQVIFVMHGIRDEGTWPDVVQQAIGNLNTSVKVIRPLYRRFAMLPFLLYWDRQRNVRWFMDEYTQIRAKYPNLETVDFIGHSNGTYILASALQQYSVLTVRNVFFAGSVVPTHYDWPSVIGKRVKGTVWNVCADTDWVVAIFPQLFQQISDWRNIDHPRVGLLDIGSAGFRGFRLAAATEGRLFNLKFISGRHGAAFEPANVARIGAIAEFVTSGSAKNLSALQQTSEPSASLEMASNLSWLIWIAGLGIISLGGLLVVYHFGGWWLAVYIALLIGVLASI